MGKMMRHKKFRYTDPCCSGHRTEDHRNNSVKSPSYRTREKRQWKREEF